jgi:hypothetical protein
MLLEVTECRRKAKRKGNDFGEAASFVLLSYHTPSPQLSHHGPLCLFLRSPSLDINVHFSRRYPSARQLLCRPSLWQILEGAQDRYEVRLAPLSSPDLEANLVLISGIIVDGAL